jgi:hypothetical protein
MDAHLSGDALQLDAARLGPEGGDELGGPETERMS